MRIVQPQQTDNGINYGALKALVIDDFPNMRIAFKAALASFGVTKVDMAADASEAIMRVRGTTYDVIVSDYNLGEGRDGQQLLEELRHNNLISLTTAYLMVTAETVYERVVAAAELAPDDYLIKPFSTDVLKTRMDAVISKKRLFSKAYNNLFKGQHQDALGECDKIIKEHPKHFIDAIRLKGEVLGLLGRHEEAKELYQQVIAVRAVPWAKLGLAKSIFMLNEADKAESILNDVIQKNPEFVIGYDLLADVQLAQNKTHEAQSTLKRAVNVSAKSAKRQRLLASVAVKNGDRQTAINAYTDAIKKARYSPLLKAEDFGSLCRLHVESGNVEQASNVLVENRKVLMLSDEGRFVNALSQSVVASASGRQAEAKQYLNDALDLRHKVPTPSPDTMLDLASKCLEFNKKEEAARLLKEVACNHHDNEQTISRAKQICQDAGAPDIAESIVQESLNKMTQLSQEAALKIRRKEFSSAAQIFIQASEEAPRNVRTLMNAVWAICKRLKEEGYDPGLLSKASNLLDSATKIDPNHPRLMEITKLVNDTRKSFGVTL